MKVLAVFKGKWIILVGVIFLLPILGGCQDDEPPEGEVQLSEILENPDYASLPLVGTSWKLIGFVDEQWKRVKLVEPDGEVPICLHLMKMVKYADGHLLTRSLAGIFWAMIMSWKF